MTDKPRKLTAKQQAFVNEYCLDKNATQAAIRAGYSKATAHSIGGENLKKPEIAQEIAKIMAERAENSKITLDRVLDAYASIGFADIDLNDVKPADKLKALEGLMRHLGGFQNEQMVLNASDSLKDLLQAATNKGHILPKDAEERERLHS